MPDETHLRLASNFAAATGNVNDAQSLMPDHPDRAVSFIGRAVAALTVCAEDCATLSADPDATRSAFLAAASGSDFA